MKTQKFIVEITSVTGFSIDMEKLKKQISHSLPDGFILNVYEG